MSNPFSNQRGPVAVEPDDDGSKRREPNLLTLLQVGGRFYWRVTEALDGVGLTPPAYELLTHLTSEADVALDQLAELLRRPAQEVWSLAEELTELGLVREAAGRGFDGPVRVTLTPRGSERAREGRARLDAVLSEFAARVGSEDRMALDRLLSKVGR